ncbi:transmembrane protein 207 isoform X1 [Myotis myotis]|uniref:transmembrane protein 207 isoform X1 n=1 Tax=Myotis myotis TaxID=51298 RepID=UPI00174E03E5|nr:transmembrane protein 207 isoform X1 [Myotis myotis]XP_036208341.1 transmembrane protein 207 isoform X1 [Myotis myotis]
MSRSSPFSFTSVISKTGTWCLPLFQLVLSDPPCEENEMYVNYKNQYPNDWYIWFLLLIFLVALLCGAVLFCLPCWLRRCGIGSSRRTVAVFAVGDLDPVYELGPSALTAASRSPVFLRRPGGTEAAVNPAVGIHLPTQNPELYHVSSFNTSGAPPPYEEILKSSQL